MPGKLWSLVRRYSRDLSFFDEPIVNHKLNRYKFTPYFSWLHASFLSGYRQLSQYV